MQAPVLQTELPVSVQKVLKRARVELQPTGVVLFGSRARQEASPTSDFDFAFMGVENDLVWTRFCNFVRYDAPTLFQIDLIRYETAPPELKSSIEKEGRPIYEPAATR